VIGQTKIACIIQEATRRSSRCEVVERSPTGMWIWRRKRHAICRSAAGDPIAETLSIHASVS
jgi:hypothetical protein